MMLSEEGTQPTPVMLSEEETQPNPLRLSVEGTQPNLVMLSVEETQPKPKRAVNQGTYVCIVDFGGCASWCLHREFALIFHDFFQKIWWIIEFGGLSKSMCSLSINLGCKIDWG